MKERQVEKELAEKKKTIYFIYFEWRYAWYYEDHKIIRSFIYINWWYYCNSKTWNKKQESGFPPALLAVLAALLVQPVISSVVKGINERVFTRAGRGYMDKKISAPSFKHSRYY